MRSVAGHKTPSRPVSYLAEGFAAAAASIAAQ
jgi:hypothetical protein